MYFQKNKLIIKSYIENLKIAISFKKDIKYTGKIFTEFISYLRFKKIITCDCEYLKIEEYVFTKIQLNSNLSSRIKNENIFFNNQLILFEWIESSHLNIKNISDKKIRSYFQKFLKDKSIYKKSILLMKIIEEIYYHRGKLTSSGALISYLIIFIVQLNVENILINLLYMEIFNKNIPNVKCSTCITYEKNELEYYTVILKSAIKYIKELDYYKLDIKKDEYEKKIIESAKKIKTDFFIEKNSESEKNIFSIFKRYFQ